MKTDFKKVWKVEEKPGGSEDFEFEMEDKTD